MNEPYLRNVLEAALLAAGKPLQLAELGQLFDENTRPKMDELRAALDALASEYANRAVELKETATGFRIQVRREFSTEISRLWPERPARYSRALLETLALVAYRQPITRAEIEAVRGVAVNPNIIKTLIERNWVRVVGHRDVPGRPELLGTTREFLDYFNLRSLDELPPLAEIKVMGDYNLQLDLPNASLPTAEQAMGEGNEGAVVAVVEVAPGEAVEIGATDGVAGSETAASDAAEGDESVPQSSVSTESASGESRESVEDSVEEEGDDEELSADGNGSRELVAASRDSGD